jgi:hypothetical protein
MFDSLEETLEELPPGPVLGAALYRLDLGKLSGHDRVAVMRAHRRMAAHYAARTYEAMASISDVMHDLDDDYELAHRAASAEIRAGLALTRRTADVELDLALEMSRRLPTVWSALADGLIDVPKARVIIDATSHLPIDTAQRVTADILPDAARLTTGQMRSRLARLCMEVDPADAVRRYEEAVDDRRVAVDANPEGSANLTGYDLPAERAVAIGHKINRIARRLKTSTETRTMDQLRADVFLDLLEGKHHRHRSETGVVELQVDLATLTGLSESPGDLAGYGPVVADIARQVADSQHGSEWRWTVTHPESGLPVAGGLTRRRPSRAQRRAVETRDRTCVFPGCRVPATSCDLDHRTPWSRGGRTHTHCLSALCRHDHVNRHLCGWTYCRLPDGDYLWTSPLGHRYTTSGRPP